MDAVYGARHWQHYHFLLTLSDEMPGNGVEHTSSSDDGTDGDGFTDQVKLVDTAGLLAHEFNHSWDGKYRRPADLATNNFQVPEHTELLWIYEGMTQYYGDFIPTRAGLKTVDLLREQLASTYAREDHETGRLTRPLIDTADAAPFLYDAPRSLSNERRTAGDFYAEGELLWLDVAARIDALSHGTKSLDGFCKTFFGIANTPPEVNPYTYDQFLAALDAYAPYDWKSYFRQRVYEVLPHPPSAFEALGWKLVYSDKPNDAETRRGDRARGIDAAYSLGIAGDGNGRLSDVYPGSPAAAAGLGLGDTIVAVDDRTFSVEGLTRAIAASTTSRAPITMIVKKDDVFRTVAIDYHGGVRHPHLVRVDGVPDTLSALMAPHRSNPK
jgi:predicted metalloprotease with PDZ domain